MAIDHPSPYMPRADVYVCGVGARTPLGSGVAPSAAAVRAAISAVAAHPRWVDHAGEPFMLAYDPHVGPQAGIGARLEAMLLPAIAEAAGDALSAGERTECWVAISDARPGLPAQTSQRVTHAVASAFTLPARAVHALAGGHAAGLMAVQAAAQRVSAGDIDFAVVAGVDSYHDPETLEWLDDQRLLMSSENRNGFPPGEGAGAWLLARRSTAERHGLPVFAAVVAAATTLEPHAIRGTGVCTGVGLTAAVRGVVDGLRAPGELVTDTYCDLNGERYRNEEFLYTLMRTQEAFADAHDYQCPADCWGDVGAASGPLFGVLAIAAGQRGYAKGPHPILWAGSESGYRAAVLLRLPAEWSEAAAHD